jgi:hypothetical protein
MFEVFFWLVVMYFVFRFFRMLERGSAPRQAPPPPPARGPASSSATYTDIEDAKFEDITPPKPPAAPDSESKQ